MLPKKFRIHHSKDIMLVLRRGRKIRLGIGNMRILQNFLEYPRATVIVGNTVSKKATIRNTLKRRIREALRKELIPSFKSFDVIIIAKPDAVNASYQQIIQEFKILQTTAPSLWQTTLYPARAHPTKSIQDSKNIRHTREGL